MTWRPYEEETIASNDRWCVSGGGGGGRGACGTRQEEMMTDQARVCRFRTPHFSYHHLGHFGSVRGSGWERPPAIATVLIAILHAVTMNHCNQTMLNHFRRGIMLIGMWPNCRYCTEGHFTHSGYLLRNTN